MIKITGTLGTAFAVVLTAAVILFMVMVAKNIYKFFHGSYTEPESYPQPRYTEAAVVSKWSYMEKRGTKTSSEHRIVYVAEFVTQLGETVKYEIPQELYHELEQNQKGILAILEDEFFGFE